MTPEEREHKNRKDRERRARLMAADPEGWRKSERERKRKANTPADVWERRQRHRRDLREADPSYITGWTLREDGIFDEVAVDVAARGVRRVRLTSRERRAAIRRCLDSGLSVTETSERLHIDPRTISRTRDVGEKTAQKGMRA